MTAQVEFDTTVAASGNNTGIEVPAALIEELGAGQRPPVLVTVNGYEYRSTVAVMGGRHMISISSAIRKETGLKGGDAIHVVLAVAAIPRSVNVPDDFAAALGREPELETFFQSLSNSLQRYHVDTIEGAKTAETRPIQDALDLLASWAATPDGGHGETDARATDRRSDAGEA